MMLARIFAFLCALTLIGRAEVSFIQDIRPILSAKCIACHDPDDGVDARGKPRRKTGLQFHKSRFPLSGRGVP